MKKAKRMDDESSEDEKEQVERADMYEAEKATRSDDSFDEQRLDRTSPF